MSIVVSVSDERGQRVGGDVDVDGDRDDLDLDLDLDYWVQLARNALMAVGVSGPAEMHLAFVDEDLISELNVQYMGSQGPTDVLSFPIDGESIAHAESDSRVDGGSLEAPNRVGDVPLLLGDVIICPAVADRNAPDHAGTLEDELALLVVHGVLHLLGYDHMVESERIVMQSRERELLTALHGELARCPWP